MKVLYLVVFLAVIFWQGIALANGEGEPYQVELPRYSIGLQLGPVGGTASEAVDGYKYTEFGSGALFGVNFFYAPDPNIQVGVRLEHYTMDLTEKVPGYARDNFGTLEVTPIVFALKVGPQREAQGVSGHFSVGLGFNLTSFELSSEWSSLGLDATVDDVFVTIELGGGVDYYFSRNTSVSLDLLLPIATSLGIEFSGPGGTASEDLNVTTIQFVLGIQYHF